MKTYFTPITKCMWSCAAALLLVCCCASPALAQQGLPQALIGIKQADGVCKNESPNKNQVSTTAAAPDAACTLAAPAWDAFLAKPGALVVDTRTESEFTEFHAPEAVRMDLSSIRYKSYLRTKPLLLIGSGKSDRERYEACSQLRAQGFQSVHVAVGGMAAYVATGRPILGKAPAAFDLARLDAAHLMQEAYFAQNLVFTINGAGAGESVPYAIALNDSRPEALFAMLEKRRKESKLAVAAVVLVSATPLTEDAYQRYLQAIRPVSLLFYSDGNEALAKFAATQKAVWAAHARGPRQPRCG